MYLQPCKAVIDIGDKSLRLFDNLVTVPLITAQDHNNVLTVIRTVRIPAHSEAILPVCLQRRTRFSYNSPAIVQAWPGLKQRGLGVAPSLVQPSNRQTLCRIINVRPSNQLLRRGTKLAYLSEIDVSDPFNRGALNRAQNQAEVTAAVTHEHPSVTNIAFSDKLDAVTATGLKLQQAQKRLEPAQFAELVDLLYRYKHLFTVKDDIPLSNLPAVRIPMKDMTPVRVKPYKLSPEMDDLLHKELLKWKKAGVVESTTSAFSSPVFILKKPAPPNAPKDYKPQFRAICDLRRVNLQVQPIFFGLPTAEQAIHKIGHARAKFFSVLDNSNAFYGISIDEASRDVTAISSSRLHLRFKRLCLGLSCSSALYQLQLSNLLDQQLQSGLCLLYQDDLLIFSRNWDRHLSLLQEILGKYDQANLRLNPNKSQLASSEVTYLGHTFDQNGVRISDSRAKVMSEWPLPRNSRDFRRFLGVISYVRRYVPSYSSLVSPLTALTSTKAEFTWGPQQQQAFDKVKEILTSEPILGYPRFDNLEHNHFIVICDASRSGFGACLSQCQPDNTEKIIEYRARATNKHEKLGGATDLELGCFIQAIRWFESLLRLAPFVVRSDHLALTYLSSLKYSTNAKLQRYALLLSDFQLKVEYKKGKSHTLADSLSRKPFSEAEKAEAEQIPPDADLAFLSSLTEDYLNDMQPSHVSILKSHSRHQRRHSKILHFAPLTFQDVIDPPGPRNNEHQQASDNNASKITDAELPTFEHIMQTASHLPPVTLQSQHEDEYFGKIIDFLTDQKLPADKQEARRIVLIAENFEIIDNQLVKIAHFQRKRREMYQPLVKVLCLPQEWRLPVLASYHDFLNHATVEKSYYTMREKFFWRNLYADLTNYVQSCPACQLLRCRARRPIRSGSWEVPKPFEVAHIDHLGKISLSWQGYNYILTVSDNHTQYMEAVPVKTTGTAETAQNIYEKYYLRHGFVPNLISDRAQSFLANLTQELFKICKFATSKPPVTIRN
jgi:hypothetical protein